MDSQQQIISDKIESLKSQVTGYGLEDAILLNQIRSYTHKLDKMRGVKPSCDIDDDSGSCLSCGA
jgi:hypothetical protein